MCGIEINKVTQMTIIIYYIGDAELSTILPRILDIFDVEKLFYIN